MLKNNNKLFIFLAILTLSSSCSTKKDKLPILGSREAITKTINGEQVIDSVYHTIEPFRFINQDSMVVTNDTFKGKIYVADFFFTSCPTICPIMKRNMLTVYKQFKGNPEVGILSHSIDPRHDSVSVLKKYAHKLGVDDTQWDFVTGTKDSLYEIAEHSYMVSAIEDKNQPGGIVHSGAFLLVDKDRHIRGVYDGTNEDAVKQMIDDMNKLLAEYKKQ
ncbi:protein SCO1/2 [Solitalea koreensis]|uniref:Protein SCO1/2 n=2 Tax=Solitalea koreensis TaxID=543615 RepID=A0A521BLF1_9SPHI|nr:protein SCO1/2 [Solitalea koreensis]